LRTTKKHMVSPVERRARAQRQQLPTAFQPLPTSIPSTFQAPFQAPSKHLPTPSNGLLPHPPYTPPRLEGLGRLEARPPKRG
jgi:hypothetical protein